MTYCFICNECGARYESHERDEGCRNPDCLSANVRRDYKAESAGVDRWALKFWGTRHQRREPENA